jgi:hypothetical protein
MLRNPSSPDDTDIYVHMAVLFDVLQPLSSRFSLIFFIISKTNYQLFCCFAAGNSGRMTGEVQFHLALSYSAFRFCLSSFHLCLCYHLLSSCFQYSSVACLKCSL